MAATAAMAGPASRAEGADPSQILTGTFPESAQSATAMAAWSGKQPAVQVLFTDFDGDQTSYAQNRINEIWNSGSVPLLTWEVFTDHNNRTAAADIDKQIARGDHDSYLKAYAGMIKTFLSGPDGKFKTADDRRLYLRFAHEMNGDWYPWSAGYKQNGTVVSDQTPGDYINMWRHVHDVFADAGLSDAGSLQWMWAPMNTDAGGAPKMEEYYPGSAYVDWVAVDAYNWGTKTSWSTWTSPESLMKDALGRVSALAPDKPLAIPETGTPSGSNGQKQQWFNDLYGFTSYYQSASGARVKMLSYFNINKTENGAWMDWAGFSAGGNGDESYQHGGTGYKGYSTYRTLINKSNMVAPNSGDPRVLTNDQFAGR